MSEYFEGINNGPITGNPPPDLLWLNQRITQVEDEERLAARAFDEAPSDEALSDELNRTQQRLDFLYERLGVHAGLRDVLVLDSRPR